MIVHGVLVAQQSGGRRRGVLIRGPSGSGKSDLAVRLLDEGYLLVADDQVLLWTSAGRLFGRAPDALHGLIEVRGLGIRPHTAISFAPVNLIVTLHDRDQIARMPEPEHETHLGLNVPVIRLAGFEASTPAKLRRVLMTLG